MKPSSIHARNHRPFIHEHSFICEVTIRLFPETPSIYKDTIHSCMNIHSYMKPPSSHAWSHRPFTCKHPFISEATIHPSMYEATVNALTVAPTTNACALPAAVCTHRFRIIYRSSMQQQTDGHSLFDDEENWPKGWTPVILHHFYHLPVAFLRRWLRKKRLRRNVIWEKWSERWPPLDRMRL